MSKRQPMPEIDPKERIRTFEEVALGYNEEQAIEEAKRCLQCPRPTCVQGCPVSVDIPSFILCIREGRFEDAAKVIKKKNHLPAICGRVCPVEEQCENSCILNKKGEPIAIGNLERFASDCERKFGSRVVERAPPTGKKVAVVGSGPAGLTAAADLAKLGHKVTIFEALHVPGGVLMYGIPEFRLPKKIVEEEIDYVRKLGVEIKTDVIVGRTITVGELLQEFDAVFIGTGAGPPQFLGIPGENLAMVFSANEFLTRVNLMKAYDFPNYDTPIRIGKRVAVIGAGNVAFDSARSALRLGAEEVSIVYRRTEREMPARLEEIRRAREEGVQFKLLTLPTQLLGDENGCVRAMRCVRMELGPPDSSGRRSPIPVKGSDFEFDTDTVIVAIGRAPNPLVPSTTSGLKVSGRGTIVVDEAARTSRRGVFAGGDIVTGEATVIKAMGAGRKAALAIHSYVMGEKNWPSF